MAAQSPSMVRSAALRRSAFSLAKAFSRGRVYLYDEYMKILNVGTEPYRRGGTPRERTHLA